MQLNELLDYIGSLLDFRNFRDYCPNGLQIEGRGEVYRIATAVSASLAVLEAATAWRADAIIVHHGYFWKNEAPEIIGLKKRRLAHLLRHDVSLLAYHLPLDAHPLLGNNAQLAKQLNWREEGRFGEQNIACFGRLPQPKTPVELAENISKQLRRTPQIIGDDTRPISRIAWCSGGAQSYFEQAIALGVDAFMTGEISEPSYHLAQESGVRFIAAGHHATERFGVQALGEHLATQFSIEHQFFDQENPV